MSRKRALRVLGIESSCDETAAAIVSVAGSSHTGFRFHVQSNIVASQVALHARYGGVVPEVAAREHVAAILPTIERAVCARGRAAADRVDAIAVTAGPGLLSALGVGVETARCLAFVWRKPLIAVNHIEGHVMSALLRRDEHEGHEKRGQQGMGAVGQARRGSPQALRPSSPKADLTFPVLALIVSGGHTELLLMRAWGKHRCIGATRDDAAGEAFDKVAKLLGLPYPGGPAVAEAATRGNAAALRFPRGMARSKDFDFSFSGMKTAVRYHAENYKSQISDPAFVADVCASFQEAVVDVLVTKTVRAAAEHNARTVLLGGGVAANQRLREQLVHAITARFSAIGYRLPAPAYTGDNAAMIAAAGGVRFLLGERTRWQDLRADANWELGR